jgi:hypothetical protein
MSICKNTKSFFFLFNFLMVVVMGFEPGVPPCKVSTLPLEPHPSPKNKSLKTDGVISILYSRWED